MMTLRRRFYGLDGVERTAVVSAVVLAVYFPVMLHQLGDLRREGASSIISLQSSSPKSTLQFMELFGMLGDEYCHILLIPFVYLGVSTTLGLRWIALLMLSMFIGGWINTLIHDPRPFWYSDEIEGLLCERFSEEFAFANPSGHAQNGAAILLFLAREFMHSDGFAVLARRERVRRIVWIAVALVVFLMGLSRIYTGSNFFYQVVTGWCLGPIVVCVFLRAEVRASQWFAAKDIALKPNRFHLTFVASTSALLLVLAFVPYFITSSSFSIPEQWKINDGGCPHVSEIGGLSNMVLAIAVLSYFPTVISARRHFPWCYLKADWGRRWQRLLRGAIGALLAFAVHYSVDAAVSNDSPAGVVVVFRYYLKGILALLSLSVAAPFVCHRFRLTYRAAGSTYLPDIDTDLSERDISELMNLSSGSRAAAQGNATLLSRAAAEGRLHDLSSGDGSQMLVAMAQQNKRDDVDVVRPSMDM